MRSQTIAAIRNIPNKKDAAAVVLTQLVLLPVQLAYLGGYKICQAIKCADNQLAISIQIIDGLGIVRVSKESLQPSRQP